MTYYVFKCPVTSSTSLICNLSKLTNQTIQGYITPIASTDSNGNPNSVDNEQFLIPSNFYNQPYLLSISQLTCISSQYIIPVFLNSLKISWIPNTTYTFQVNDSFVLDNFNQGSPLTTITYTTNPTPSILASDPVPGDSATANNDNITLDFQRHVFGTTGSFYLFQIGPTAPTLIRQYHADTEIRYSHGKIILDTRNVLLPGTTYYLLADPNCLQDYDGFVWSGLPNTTAFRFTTAGEPTFRDLIVYEVSSSIVSALIGVKRSSAIGHFVTSSTIIPNAVKRSNFSTPVRLNSVSTIHSTVGKFYSSINNHLSSTTNITAIPYKVKIEPFTEIFSTVTFNLIPTQFKGIILTLNSLSSINININKTQLLTANLLSVSTIFCIGTRTEELFVISSFTVSINVIKQVSISLTISSVTTVNCKAFGFVPELYKITAPGTTLVENSYHEITVTDSGNYLFGISGDIGGFNNYNYGNYLPYSATALNSTHLFVGASRYPNSNNSGYYAGAIFAYKLSDGSLDFTVIPNGTGNTYYGGEIAVNDSYLVILGAYDCQIFDSTNGNFLRKLNNGYDSFGNPFSIGNHNRLAINSTSVFLSGDGYAGSGTIFAYDISTGNQRWNVNVSGNTMTADENYLYASSATQNYSSNNELSSTPVYKINVSTGNIDSSITINSSDLYNLQQLLLSESKTYPATGNWLVYGSQLAQNDQYLAIGISPSGYNIHDNYPNPYPSGYIEIRNKSDNSYAFSIYPLSSTDSFFGSTVSISGNYLVCGSVDQFGSNPYFMIYDLIQRTLVTTYTVPMVGPYRNEIKWPDFGYQLITNSNVIAVTSVFSGNSNAVVVVYGI